MKADCEQLIQAGTTLKEGFALERQRARTELEAAEAGAAEAEQRAKDAVAQSVAASEARAGRRAALEVLERQVEQVDVALSQAENAVRGYGAAEILAGASDAPNQQTAAEVKARAEQYEAAAAQVLRPRAAPSSPAPSWPAPSSPEASPPASPAETPPAPVPE